MMDDPCDEWKPPFWGAFFCAELPAGYPNNPNNCSTYFSGWLI